MKKIDIKKINRINYIKLGQNNLYAKECLENGYIKIDYREIDHNLCIHGQWEAVREDALSKYHCSAGTATNYRNQIKRFYEADSSVLWITFSSNKMWWCISSDKKITLNTDGTKTRKTDNGWFDKDIKNNILSDDRIRGDISCVQFFQGTICNIPNKNYIINKINGELSADVVRCEEGAKNLKQSVKKLISELKPKDFELLVDLLFRQAGWQRTDYAGGNLPNIDLALYSPITNEKIAVQIRSEFHLRQFNDWKKIVLNTDQFDKLFYITHTSVSKLKTDKMDDEDRINLIMNERLSELVVSYGLVDWLIRKVS